MTVCRYFRNGYCRNGDSCRFEHVYYNQRSAPLNTPGTDQTLGDIDLMLRGRQYLFSCIPGRQIHLNCRGFTDLSPEEIRVKYLECRALNNYQLFQSEMSSHQEYVERKLREILRNPTLLDQAQSPTVSSTQYLPFVNEMIETNAFSPATTNCSVFAVPSPSANFSATLNAQPNADLGPVAATSPFQKMISTPNVAANALNTVQCPAFFANLTEASGGGYFDKDRASQLMFPQATLAAPTPVSQESAPRPGMPMSTLRPNESIQMSMRCQPAPQMHISQPIALSQENPTADAEVVYTPTNVLSPQDLAAFQDRSFTIATLPLVPPSKELCF